MAHNPAVMKAATAVAVANCLGRFKDLQGRDINTDRRFGYQCMDLWNWFRTYVLGFGDILVTPDAASVWELNSQPGLRLWQFFDGIAPDRPGMPGDVGIMNRQFFGNGVGHIFIVLRDLGAQLEVLELNGLGDGFEDDAGGQHGSPARIHIWPKTNLYGYLRWIGPAPQSGTLAPAGTTKPKPKEWDEMATPEQIEAIVRKAAGESVWIYSGSTDPKKPNSITMWRRLVNASLASVANTAQLAALTEAVKQLAATKGLDGAALVKDIQSVVSAEVAKVGEQVIDALEDGTVEVNVTVAGGQG